METQVIKKSAETGLASQLENLSINSENDLLEAIALCEEAKDVPTFDVAILTKALAISEVWLKSNFSQDNPDQVRTFNFYYSKISVIQLALKKEGLKGSTRLQLK